MGDKDDQELDLKPGQFKHVTQGEVRKISLEIWDQLETTDTKFTKRMTTGAKLTSINAEYQLKKMTEVFGAAGKGWGYELLHSEFVDGHDMVQKTDDGPVNHGPTKVHTCRVRLWYQDPLDFQRKNYIQATGHTPFIYMTTYGPHTDMEYEKKSITDAITKAMSFLGMGGDVRMGLFDDNEYVSELQREEAIDQAVDKEAETIKQRQEFEEWYAKCVEHMQNATDVRVLEIIYKPGKIRVAKQGTPDQIIIFDQTKTEKLLSFKAARINSEVTE